MLVLEDLDNLKQTEDYCLHLQKIASYGSCRYTLRNEVDVHLKFLMCDTKHKFFTRDLYVIEASHKMPVDSADFDYVYITDMVDYQQYHDDLAELKEHRIVAKIAHIFDNLILVKLASVRSRRERVDSPKLNPDRPYHVDFIPNRITTRVAHRALEDLRETNMTEYLKTFEMENAESREGDIEDFEWMNDSIENNEEQQTAIRNIVNCTSYPSPYIIFGGPGTGKSSTLVEAIAQIVKLKKKSHILVTASSNSACDDIGNRLLKFVSKNKILRIYSPSFDHKPDKIDVILQKMSNFRNRTTCSCNKRSCIEMDPLDDPTYDEFYTARVVIVTLVSCGRIVSAGVSPNHFDYIFVDEAAAECEQRTLIPIAGLGLSLNKVNAQIVLCGDHKQLGAVVSNSFARKLGMEVNFLS
jgi:superfamily I DNA and/or RNA helicase